MEPPANPGRFTADDARRVMLDAALAEGAMRFNPPLIGRGRLAVMQALQAIQARNADLPEADRTRTMTRTAFNALCDRIGGVSDTGQFLRFLHNAGTVFWREEMFGGDVIIDQGWVLEAIYTVLHRDKCLSFLRRAKGRFTSADLSLLIWDTDGYNAAEQRLFIEFMTTCGICFALNRATVPADIEYAAPDLLPDLWDPSDKADRWGDAAPDAEATFVYDALPPALIRNLICRIGAEAGLRGTYWKNGLYGFEERTRAKVMAEQDLREDWTGEIRIMARGGEAARLLDMMTDVLAQEEARLGLSSDRGAGARRGAELAERNMPTPVLAHEPRSRPQIWVSYAWDDPGMPKEKSREAIVDALCDAARAKGFEVLRDREAMKRGDRISAFMDRLARGDRIVVVLSDKYLRSRFCMTELYDMWRLAGAEPDRLLRRVTFFAHPDADIRSDEGRERYRRFWLEEYARKDELRKADVAGQWSAVSFAEFVCTRDIAQKIDEIMRLIEDVLKARTIEELIS